MNIVQHLLQSSAELLVNFYMPTKKKRVGFIPREDVMKIIEELSLENNLSNSKIINILVEEALSIRGILNKRNGKATKLYDQIRDDSNVISEGSADFIDNENYSIKTKIKNHKNHGKTTLLKQTNQESFDLMTYKKFLSFLKFQEMMDEYNN